MAASDTCGRKHPLAETNVSWGNLKDSQGKEWRHKCAACAYELGYQDALRDVKTRIAELLGNLT